MTKIELPISEQLMHNTVRLECLLGENKSTTGTGFFFNLKINEHTVPLIITNKHVIDGSLEGTFVLTKQDKDGYPVIGQYERIKLKNFESLWIKHPDPNIDLAAFPLAPLLNEASNRGTDIFFIASESNIIPKAEALSELSSVEDVVMIGYPNGIWDKQNNRPIVRRGITATDPKLDYDGLPIFLIDCACFPGSSGSPVFIFNQGSYTVKNTLHAGTRIYLLGILFAGPQHVAEGEIKIIDVPLLQVPISLSQIPNNLGFVIKAEKIEDFAPLIEKIIAAKSQS